MKKSIFLIIFILMLQVFSVVAAEPALKLANGLELIQTTREMGEDGFCNISVLKVDLNNRDYEIKPLYSTDGAHYLETVPSLVEQGGAVAAINAEFFAWGSEGGSPIGYNVSGGELVSDPCITENVASVAITDENKFIFDYFESQMTLENLTTGDSSPVKHINKYDDLSGLCIYTPVWGKYSLGAEGNLIEVVVKNDKVAEIRKDAPPVTIPENGYVIAGLADLTDFLTERLHVGDKVNLDINISPDVDAENVIGGGTLLVKNGVAAPITHNIGGRNPRSAFGVDKRGRYAYLIAVDGRGAGGSIGMTLGELTSFMLELGIYNGINFDGGASTQLAVNFDGSAENVNTPSQNPYRKVINALGVVSKSNVTIPAIEYTTESFEKQNASLYVYPKDTKAEFSVSDEKEYGGMRSGKLEYNFETESENKLSAGFSLNKPMIFKEPIGKISLDVFGFKESKMWLRAMVTDSNGEIHRITLANEINWNGWKHLDVSFPEEISAPAKLTEIYIVQPGADVKSKGALYFDNLKISYSKPPEEDTQDPSLPSESEGENLGEFVFFAGVQSENTLISKLYETRINSLLKLEKNVIYSDFDATKAVVKEYKNASFITMKDIGFTNLYENKKALTSAKNNNIIALANKNPLEYSGYKEAFSKTDKNIIVLFESSEFVQTKLDKVTYIGIPKTAPILNPLTKSMKVAEFLPKEFKMQIKDHKIW